ncbi:MAG: agmatinase [Acidimicrobiia bacterium]|nr:agmatinase [Acidimicrobiia bacterium]
MNPGTPFDASRVHAFSSGSTFAGVPAATLEDLQGARAVIVGAPFDWGTSYRPGTRFGPKAIRESDYLAADAYRPHLPTGLNALEGVVDIGDIELRPGDIEGDLDRIAATIERISGDGSIPIVLGGDHTITYANATGVARTYGFGEVALVHFDAHADTGETTGYGSLYGHGTPMRRLIESGAVPGSRFVQIGLRGYWPGPDTVAWMREQGLRGYLMTEIEDRGLKSVVDEAVAHAGDGADAVFLSVDIDVVDPGMAPGTGTPEPGGLTSRQILDTVRRMSRELRIVGADIVEVSPPYDGPGAITSFLANRIVMEVLNGLAERAAGVSS